MKVLFLDTETNGLPKNSFAPYTEANCWPAVLQLSWSMYTVTGKSMKPISKRDVGVALPEGIAWDTGAAAVHGISEAEARYGVDPTTAFTELQVALADADMIVAHNLGFDKPVVRAAAHAAGVRALWPTGKCELCTMQMTRDLVAIPSGPLGKYVHKAPKLSELYEWLYGHSYEMHGSSLHSARSDTHCLSQCFLGLIRKGHLVCDETGVQVMTPAPLLRSMTAATRCAKPTQST